MFNRIRYTSIFIASTLLMLSGCASTPPHSIAELETKAPDDFNGKVQSIEVAKAFPSVVNQVAHRMDKCLVYSYKWSKNGAAQEKWVHHPKGERLSKGKVRLYIETAYTDYGFFSDDKETQYNFMVDVERISANKTKVTTYLINYMKWGDVIIKDLQGDKDAPCPSTDR